MSISVFDLFSIGMGPSSSHTIGPMRASRQFLQGLDAASTLEGVARVQVELFGSLALTGKGHSTDIALLLGLSGEQPESVDLDSLDVFLKKIKDDQALFLLGKYSCEFIEERDLLFENGKFLPFHSNAMRFTVFGVDKKKLASEVYYSVGGGFVLDHPTAISGNKDEIEELEVPYPFNTAKDLLAICEKEGFSIAELMMENEKHLRSEGEVVAGLGRIWEVMKKSIDKGCVSEGILPGGLNVRRRAPQLFQSLIKNGQGSCKDPAEIIDWVSLYALAVNEENAAGGRVVTAPTNGAAGVIPAVLKYYIEHHAGSSEKDHVPFLLVAAAIAILYKKGASISAAEVGCQGEVGVACSMAAGALTAVYGGTNIQIENAAEIGMEHNLGLTCDPVGGLVQIPCIERNTMGAIKAISAARLAIREEGKNQISLDKVIATMMQTGADMHVIYKETSQGGLAVNVPEC